MEKLTPGGRIPLPENFPVSWENPADEGLSWSMDSHAPAPLAPLSFSVAAAVLQGFTIAFPQLGLPIQFRLAQINGYLYVATLSTAAPPVVVVKTLGVMNRHAPGLLRVLTGRMSAQATQQQLEKLEPLLSRFDNYWQEELLPEINQHFAYFETSNLRGLSTAQLTAHFSESLRRVRRLGELHALAAFPAMAAMSMFEEQYVELFPERSSLDALRLLQGFDNQTLAGDRCLWNLSRSALASPEARKIFLDRPAVEVIPALEESPECRRFLAELRAYLQRYGQRLNAFGQLTEPSWLEEPLITVECLKAYVTKPEADPEAEQAWLVAEREEAVSEARAQLSGYPQPVRDHFETLLRAAQQAAGIKEDNHWVVERLFYHLRRLVLEFGRRLSESGVVEKVKDVFYFTSEELLSACQGGEYPSPEQVKQRKAERELFSRITPPPILGTLPHFVPEFNSPFSQAMKKGDGKATVIGVTDAFGIQGQAGSGGTVRGPARIIRSLAEAGKLQPGDVLVAPSTMPPWTPLFGVAAAVVTDSGGVLSHCAVVAREYRIPAVVGTGQATKTFHDGQILEVDGDAGTVRIVATPDG